jgi:hypothetical protein
MQSNAGWGREKREFQAPDLPVSPVKSGLRMIKGRLGRAQPKLRRIHAAGSVCSLADRTWPIASPPQANCSFRCIRGMWLLRMGYWGLLAPHGFCSVGLYWVWNGCQRDFDVSGMVLRRSYKRQTGQVYISSCHGQSILHVHGVPYAVLMCRIACHPFGCLFLTQVSATNKEEPCVKVPWYT